MCIQGKNHDCAASVYCGLLTTDTCFNIQHRFSPSILMDQWLCASPILFFLSLSSVLMHRLFLE